MPQDVSAKAANLIASNGPSKTGHHNSGSTQPRNNGTGV
jgi:hypothetical protein